MREHGLEGSWNGAPGWACSEIKYPCGLQRWLLVDCHFKGVSEGIPEQSVVCIDGPLSLHSCDCSASLVVSETFS